MQKRQLTDKRDYPAKKLWGDITILFFSPDTSRSNRINLLLNYKTRIKTEQLCFICDYINNISLQSDLQSCMYFLKTQLSYYGWTRSKELSRFHEDELKLISPKKSIIVGQHGVEVMNKTEAKSNQHETIHCWRSLFRILKQATNKNG